MVEFCSSGQLRTIAPAGTREWDNQHSGGRCRVAPPTANLARIPPAMTPRNIPPALRVSGSRACSGVKAGAGVAPHRRTAEEPAQACPDSRPHEVRWHFGSSRGAEAASGYSKMR